MAKMLGRGAKLYYVAIATASGFVNIPQLRTISEIRKTSPRVNITDLASLAEEYMGGLPDPSTISATGLWDPLNVAHQLLDADQRLARARYFKVEAYRSGALVRTGTFFGYVAEFGTGPFENQSPVDMSIVIQLSGDVTWT